MGPGEEQGPESGVEPMAPVDLDGWGPDGWEDSDAPGGDTLPPPPAEPTIPAPPPSGPRLTSWCNRVARDVGLDDVD
jgi:hypothetical protein